MKRVLFLLLLSTLTFSKTSTVEQWDTSKTYKGQDIVYYEGNYYIAQLHQKKKGKGKGTCKKTDTPADCKKWVKIKQFHTPVTFDMKTLYKTGDAVQYKGKTFIAGYNTDYVKPSTAPNHEAWVEPTGIITTLPPMPDVEADTTIAGIDSNGDGIRDDIEILIVTSVPDNPIVRAKLLTKAKGICMQMETFDSLVNPTFEDLKLSVTVLEIGLQITPECNAPTYLSDKAIEDVLFNTPERYISYEKSCRLFHTQSFPSGGFPPYQVQAKSIYDQILKSEEERNQ